MAELMARVPNAPDPGVLLGLEGQAAALYFGNFGRMLKARAPGATFDFTTRNRRPPRDPVNALLSFAYAMLTKDCFAAACTVGFDPYQGFYHVGRHGRPSLALDLMEEFRPVIADSVVLNLINNAMLADKDFLTWRDACQLTDDGRRRFFEAYEQRKATEVTHPVFGYRMSYGRMLEVQARMLAAYVRGDIPRYVGFTVR
jgi:CRISPR-associated protein Cas1